MSDALPTTGSLTDIAEHISGALDEDIVSIHTAFGELTLLSRADRIVHVLTFLRDNSLCRFTQLVDLCGVDFPERAERFDVVYHLLSMHNNQRLRVKTAIADGEPLASVRGVYPSADWFEREAFDMYGIIFSGHSDLRRLLTDYGFQGHPLRKDFPLTGFTEVRYDDEKKRVVYEPVNLVQEYRNFDYLSPWEGADYVLPGDEKSDDKQD